MKESYIFANNETISPMVYETTTIFFLEEEFVDGKKIPKYEIFNDDPQRNGFTLNKVLAIEEGE